MRKVVVSSCLLAVGMVCFGNRQQAWAAPRHKCPSIKRIWRQERLPQDRKKAAKLLHGRSKAAARSLRFTRAMDLMCVLATHKAYARHRWRYNFVLLYAGLLARHRAHRQAISVLRTGFGRSLRRRVFPVHGWRVPRVLFAAVMVARQRVRLARQMKSQRTRRREYRRARTLLRRTLRGYRSFLNLMGCGSVRAVKGVSNPWPRLTQKRLARDHTAAFAVLRFMDALTRSWEVERALGITDQRARALERLSADAVKLFGRLPRRQSVQRAAARAVAWFDLRRMITRLRLPAYATFKPNWTMSRAGLFRSKKRRVQVIVHSRNAVADALRGLTSRLTAELAPLQAIRLGLRAGPALARLQVVKGLLFERAAAQIATHRWPEPARDYVRLLVSYFGDPKPLMEKIEKLVFGSPSVVVPLQKRWKALAARAYRKTLLLADRGLADASWARLASQRLARLQRRRLPRRARVAGGPPLRPFAKVKPLLVPVSHPPPLSAATIRAMTRSPRRGATPQPSPAVRRMPTPRAMPASFAPDMAARSRKRRSRAQALLARGVKAERAKNFALARRHLLKAVAVGRHTRQLLVALGRVQLRLSDISGAVRTAVRLELAGHDRAAAQLRLQLRKLIR